MTTRTSSQSATNGIKMQEQQTPSVSGGKMSGRAAGLFAGLFIVAAVLAAIAAPESNAGFRDSAAALAFITAAAVTIERVLELFWDLIGKRESLGEWWPLRQVLDKAAEIETQAGMLLSSELVKKVQEDLEKAKEELNDQEQRLGDVIETLAKLQDMSALTERFDAAKTLAPGSARIAMTARVGTDTAALFSNAASLGGKITSTWKGEVEKASRAISVATQIVGSFQDNPARRLASIAIGTSAGMLISGFIGLNMFAAILENDAGHLGGVAGLLLTGIIIGLGATPTHEAIKALQNHKKNASSPQIAVVPELSAGAATLAGDAALHLFGQGLGRVRAARSAAMSTQVVALRSTD